MVSVKVLSIPIFKLRTTCLKNKNMKGVGLNIGPRNLRTCARHWGISAWRITKQLLQRLAVGKVKTRIDLGEVDGSLIFMRITN